MGRLRVPSWATYSSAKRCGIWKSSWKVEHCHSRPEGVLDLEIDLGAVEGAAALVDLERPPERLEHAAQRRLGLVPGGGLAHEALGPRREVEVEVLEAEELEHLEREA